MRNNSPIAAAVGLAILWAAMLFIVPTFMNLFVGFKVEMSLPTLVMVTAFRFPVNIVGLVLVTAVLLGYRQVIGWVFALALCIACDLIFLGLLMPYISLMNNLSGGDTPTPPPPTTNSLSPVLTGLLIGAFLLNQLLFIALLAKRRAFLTQPQLPAASNQHPNRIY